MRTRYLIDYRQQLKYTGMIVAITVLVGSALGAAAFHYSRGQSRSLAVEAARYPDLHPEIAKDLEGFERSEDRKVLIAIILSIGLLTLAVAITGILVTHRFAGPAYRLRIVLQRLQRGDLDVHARVRKGDELAREFAMLETFIQGLQADRASLKARVDKLIELSSQSNENASMQTELKTLRSEIQKAAS